MRLRPYQQNLLDSTRLAFREHKNVFMQLATGGGKTVIVSQITRTAFDRNFRVWFIVPRNELMDQAAEHFAKWRIPHSSIKAGRSESRAYKIHLVSKDTLMRRLKKDEIINFPDLCIFDEAHVAIDQQKTIIDALPDHSRALGISATPERTDGRGLSDIYGDIVYGPTMKELIEGHYLAPFRYFSPPLDGLDELHRKGTEYDATELEALLKRRAVYGKAISHYRELADGQPCIVFCRSIKAAEETAHKFRESGYRFESIDGRMSNAKRRAILDGVRSGALHGVTSIDLAIYGLDIPRLQVAIMLRPTISKAVYFQQIGRILRPEEGKIATIIDHVSNLAEFGHPLQDQEWNFHGTEKRKRKGKSADIRRICDKCFMYTTTNPCEHCGSGKTKRKLKNMIEVDGRLVEVKGPIPLKDRPYEERREFDERIADARQAFKDAQDEGKIDYGPIKDLCEVADDLGRSVMWVYHELNTMAYAVNVPLLSAIAEAKEYKRGWVYFKQKQLQQRAG